MGPGKAFLSRSILIYLLSAQKKVRSEKHFPAEGKEQSPSKKGGQNISGLLEVPFVKRRLTFFSQKVLYTQSIQQCSE